MKNRLAPVFFTAAILLAGGAACAYYSNDAVGSTAARFLELPAGGRAIAMGGTSGAAKDDAFAMYYNPAYLNNIKSANFVLMHAVYFQSMSYDYAALARNLGETGVIGAEFRYFNAGKVEETDNTGTLTGGSVQPHDSSFSLGYANKISVFNYGVSGRYISSRLCARATALAFDAGLSAAPAKNFLLSVSAANIGKGLSYFGAKESLPTTGRLGTAYAYRDFLFTADLIAPKGAALAGASGIEYTLIRDKSFSAAARAGYNSRATAGKLGGLTGWSGGLGVAAGGFSFDYAWSPYGDLGNAHRMSISILFGEPETGLNALKHRWLYH